jgi:hypothetical protein
LSEVKKITRPETPSSTLPRGMDLLIKKYFDDHRAKNKLPPELEGKVRGKLISGEIIKKWRTTNKNSEPYFYDKNLNAILFGGLDECLVDGQYYIPADYKTYGFNLKENSTSFYQTQLDCYTLLLEANGFKHLNLAYLIYYLLQNVKKGGNVKFQIEVKEIKTDPQRAKKIFTQAVTTLRGPKPHPHNNCKFCAWAKNYFTI